jgi:hypothetical protein
MKPINIILTALLLSLLATVAPLATLFAADTSSLLAADYYVAADGNDSNPGTILQPFATIEEARLAVQSRIATGDDEGHYGHAARGNETWVESIARRFGLESTLRPRGRSSTQLTKQRLLTPLFVP